MVRNAVLLGLMLCLAVSCEQMARDFETSMQDMADHRAGTKKPAENQPEDGEGQSPGGPESSGGDPSQDPPNASDNPSGGGGLLGSALPKVVPTKADIEAARREYLEGLDASEFDQKEAHFKRSIELHPTDKAWLRLGRLYETEGDLASGDQRKAFYQQAHQAFTEALRLAEDKNAAQMNLDAVQRKLDG